MSTRAHQSAQLPERWVRFRVADGRYGIEVAQVRDVREVPALAPPPQAPAWVLGTLYAYGEEISVVDARRLFSLGDRAPGPEARVVVVGTGGGALGLLVESVTDVCLIAPGEISEQPAANDGGCVRGVCHREQDTILLDARRLDPCRAHGGARAR